MIQYRYNITWHSDVVMCQCAFNNFICFRWKNMFFGRWFLRRIAGQVSHHVWGVHEHRPGTGITSQRIDSKRFCFDAKTYLKVLVLVALLFVGRWPPILWFKFWFRLSAYGSKSTDFCRVKKIWKNMPLGGEQPPMTILMAFKTIISSKLSICSFQNISMWYQHLVKFSIQTTWWFFWSHAFTIFGVFLK